MEKKGGNFPRNATVPIGKGTVPIVVPPEQPVFPCKRKALQAIKIGTTLSHAFSGRGMAPAASLCFEFWLIRCAVLKRSKWLAKAISLGSTTAKWKLLNHPWWWDTCFGCRLRANAQNKEPWFGACRVFNIVPVKFGPSCNNFTAWLKRPCKRPLWNSLVSRY